MIALLAYLGSIGGLLGAGTMALILLLSPANVQKLDAAKSNQGRMSTQRKLDNSVNYRQTENAFQQGSKQKAAPTPVVSGSRIADASAETRAPETLGIVKPKIRSAKRNQNRTRKLAPRPDQFEPYSARADYAPRPRDARAEPFFTARR